MGVVAGPEQSVWVRPGGRELDPDFPHIGEPGGGISRNRAPWPKWARMRSPGRMQIWAGRITLKRRTQIARLLNA